MRQRRVFLWLPVLLWMALIFIGSNQPSLPTQANGALDLLIKKSGHILEYAILGLLLWRACAGSLRTAASAAAAARNRRYRITPGLAAPLLALALGSLYAISDELHQRFVPTRSGNVHDVLLDTVAVTVAVVLAVLWQRYRSRSPRQS
jgi:VanZ family protein